MTGQERTVNAAIFKEWYERLEETVAQDPEELAEGNRHPAVMLLHDLICLGVQRGAIRLVVSHSTGPHGFAHLSFRYPLNQEFDWSGDIDLTRELGEHGSRPISHGGDRNSDGHSSTRRQPDRQSREGGQHTVSDECIEPDVTQQTLAAWRAKLAKIRGEERQHSSDLPAETGRLLEIVGHALAQNGAALPPEDIARIEELTSVDAKYK